MTYLEHIQRGMDLLAYNPKSIFVGQAMEFKGHAISRQVDKYPKEKLLEFPVAEEFQMGYCIGLALEGYLPISCYPRCNFAILAANQIVNHLDKWELMTGQKLKVIIKMVVGNAPPYGSLDPGHQHKANYFEAFNKLCDNIPVYDLTLNNPIIHENDFEYVLDVYDDAYHNPKSCIIVEDGNLY
jgi:pyruvate/2-oxoglutarate/acetoin dehydrogenase E1 component